MDYQTLNADTQRVALAHSTMNNHAHHRPHARYAARSIVLYLLSFLFLTQCGNSKTQLAYSESGLTAEQFELLLTQLEPPAREIAKKYSYLFVDLIQLALQQPTALTILVDKDNSLGNYVPPDLIPLDRYRNRLVLNVEGMLVSRIIISDLLAMVAEAAEDGYRLDISSAYRSYSYQGALYQRHATQLGEAEASRVSAQAGHSQHQLGTAVDFGSVTSEFDTTGAAQWLRDNGWRFGFSLSYPPHSEHITGYRYESWHWRYIGRSAALLERYFFGSQQQEMLSFLENNRHLLEEQIVYSPLHNQ